MVSMRMRWTLAAWSVLLSAPLCYAASDEPPKAARVDAQGDPLPEGATARLGPGRLRHWEGAIHALAFAPDGKMLASCGEDKSIRLWDPATGKQVRRIEWDARLWCLAWSPDGKTLAVGSDKGLVLWDPATGKEKQRLGDKADVGALAFSSNGKMLAAGGNHNAVHVWDLSTNKEIQQLGQATTLYRIAFAPDGKTLVTAHYEPVLRRWDAATGKELGRALDGKGTFSSAAFLPDGKLLTSNFNENELRLWDPDTGKEVRHFEGHKDPVLSVAVAPDGKTAASASRDGTVQLWDVAKGDEIRRFSPHPGGAFNVAFSPDAKTLAVSSVDHQIRLWDVATGKTRLPMTGHRSEVISLAFAPDGKTLASAGGYVEPVHLWDPATGKERGTMGGTDDRFVRLTFAPDGKTLASPMWAYTMFVGDLETGKVRRWPMKDQEGRHPEGNVLDFVFTPDGKTLLSTDVTGAVCSWETATGKPMNKVKTTFIIGAAAFSRDGKLLATGGVTLSPGGFGGPDEKPIPTPSEAGLSLWDVTTGKEMRKFARHDDDAGKDPPAGPRTPRMGHVRAAAFSPDAKTLVSISDDAVVIVWETATSEVRRRFGRPERDRLTRGGCVAISPDGRFLAAPLKPEIVSVWDLATGKEVASFRGDAGRVHCLAFSPDGRALASGHGDTTILLWDVSEMAKRAAAGDKLTDKQLDALWADLASQDATKAYRAVWRLSAASNQTVLFLSDQLRPITAPDAAKLARLLADLGDEDFTIRERASLELDACVETVVPALRKALERKPSSEARKRIEDLLDNLSGWSPPRLRGCRSLEVLEHLGTAQAKEVLERLAKGAPEAKLTQEAKAARDRLERGAID
jgi:WD40 repeat protein